MNKIIRSLLILIFFICIYLAKNPFLPNRVIYSNTTNFFPIIITVQDAIPENYSVSLTFSHKKLVDQGKSLLEGNDIRIYFDQSGSYNGNEVQLDRVLDTSSNWNNNATKIWFKLPIVLHANSIDSLHFRLYYGNDINNQPLQDKSKVYEYWDDFDDDNLSEWTIDAGSWSEENGFLKAENSGAQIRNNVVDITDSVIETELNLIYPNQYVGIFTRAADANNYYLFDWDGNARDWRLYRNSNGWIFLANNQNYPAPQNNDILRIKNVGNTISTQVNGQDIFSFRSNENIIGNMIGLFVNSPNSHVEFTYLLVRKAVENEPELSLGAEIIIIPTHTPTFTTTPTSSPSPTSTMTPTPSFTPSPTISVSPTQTPTPTPSNIPISEEPKMISGETQDLDNNGKIDHIRIIFNKDLNGSTVTNADFTVSSYQLGSNRPEEENGIVNLHILEGVYFDTGAKPEVFLRDRGVKDLDGNWNTVTSIKTNDAIGPYIILNNPSDNNINNNSPIKISGIASDFSSSEDAIAIDVKLQYKAFADNKWENIDAINNDSFLEPFEWSVVEWTPPYSGIFDLKIIANDLWGNTSELIFMGVNYGNNTSISLTPTFTPTSTPICTFTPTPTPTSLPTLTITPTPTSTIILTQGSIPVPNQNFYNTVNNITYLTLTPTPTPFLIGHEILKPEPIFFEQVLGTSTLSGTLSGTQETKMQNNTKSKAVINQDNFTVILKIFVVFFAFTTVFLTWFFRH